MNEYERHLRAMRHMGWLRHISLVMFGVGIVLVGLGAATSLNDTAIVIGAMLIVAGLVKVVTIRIWDGFFADAFVQPGIHEGSDHE